MELNPRCTKAKYGNKWHTIQNDRGHKHIVVCENGQRKKITLHIQTQQELLDSLLTVEGWEALYQKQFVNI